MRFGRKTAARPRPQFGISRVLRPILCAGVLAATSASAFSAPDDPLQEEAPAFNDWGARTFLIEVEPLVQKHTGWTLTDFPKFKLVTRAQYAASAVEEMQRLLPKELATPAVSAAFAAEMQRHAVGLLGAFRPLSKTIFLLPGNLKPIMRDLHVPAYFTRDLVEIVCAHEMTHAFQQEKHPYRERSSSANKDEAREAYAMLAEGHAMFVQDQVASDLKVSEAARAMAEELARRETVNPKSSGNSDAKVMLRYTAGRRFVQAVFQRGGLAKVQALFDHPPESPALILDPELFFAAEKATARSPRADSVALFLGDFFKVSSTATLLLGLSI